MSADRIWQRFTPAERMARFVVFLVAAILLAWSFRTVEIIPEFLMDAPEQVADLFARMWPVDYAYYERGVHAVLIETLHIATLGTIMTLGIAIPVGIMAASNVCRVPVLNWLATFILVSSRSVNTLVWALLFVAVFGPGTLAGTVAIAFRSVGFVGKLLGEALEEVHFGAIEALKAAGATQTSQILYGYWPAVKPAFWSIMLLRWDINIRESSVLGLVGAGGLGMIMNAAIDTFQWDRVAVILLTIFAVVVIGEVVVTFFRRRLI